MVSTSGSNESAIEKLADDEREAIVDDRFRDDEQREGDEQPGVRIDIAEKGDGGVRRAGVDRRQDAQRRPGDQKEREKAPGNPSKLCVRQMRLQVGAVQRSADDEGEVMRLAIGGGLRVQHDSSPP